MACSGGDSVRSDGTCGPCPSGQGSIDGACRTCPAGQGIRADGSCGSCPSGAVIVSDNSCSDPNAVVPITQFELLATDLNEWQRTATNMPGFIHGPLFPKNKTDCTVPTLSPDFLTQVQKFQNSKRIVNLSLGQYSVTCNTDGKFYTFLEKLVKTSGIYRLDFDIEGWTHEGNVYTKEIYSDAVISRTARVLKKLKTNYPSLYVIFTVQAVPAGNLWKFGGNLSYGKDVLNVLQLSQSLGAPVDKVTAMLVGWPWGAAENVSYFERYRDTTIALANALKQIYSSKTNSEIYSMLGIEVDSAYTKDPKQFSQLYTWANSVGLGRLVYWGGLYSDIYYQSGRYKNTLINPIPKSILEAAGVSPYRPGYPAGDSPDR